MSLSLIAPSDRTISPCTPTIFQWTGGRPPYMIIMTPSSTGRLDQVLPVVQFTNINTTALSTKVPFPTSTKVSISMESGSSDGTTHVTDITMGSGGNGDCLFVGHTSGTQAKSSNAGVDGDLNTGSDCQPIQATWSGGSPPYTLYLADALNYTDSIFIPGEKPPLGLANIAITYQVQTHDLSFIVPKTIGPDWHWILSATGGSGLGSLFDLNPSGNHNCYLDNQELTASSVPPPSQPPAQQPPAQQPPAAPSSPQSSSQGGTQTSLSIGAPIISASSDVTSVSGHLTTITHETTLFSGLGGGIVPSASFIQSANSPNGTPQPTQSINSSASDGSLSSSHSHVGLVIGVVIGSIVAIFILILVAIVVRRKRRQKDHLQPWMEEVATTTAAQPENSTSLPPPIIQASRKSRRTRREESVENTPVSHSSVPSGSTPREVWHEDGGPLSSIIEHPPAYKPAYSVKSSR